MKHIQTISRSAISRISLNIFAFLALIPHAAWAFWTWGQPLVPCGVKGTANQAVKCDFNALITLVSNLIDFFVQIAPFLAAIAFMFAGFTYITAAGDSGKIKKAHEIFIDTFWGLVIVIGAYFFIKAILTGLHVVPWANLLI